MRDREEEEGENMMPSARREIIGQQLPEGEGEEKEKRLSTRYPWQQQQQQWKEWKEEEEEEEGLSWYLWYRYG